ncbi:MAG TPA: hypothetical protein VHW74_17525 [Mycobacteriales bacterium]|jgi:hypothetical protein|nr:hypothetical protein [Mycobacteriales bacterium]
MLFWRWRDLRLYSHAAIGFAALALVVVDASVAGVRGNASSSPTPASSVAAHHQVLALGHGLHALAVASGGGRIWVLAQHGRHGSTAVAEIDPTTEQTVTSIQVPGAASHLFYGVGQVWVTGGTQISDVDPHGGHVRTIQLSGGTVSSMAFERSTAYAAVIGRDELLAVTVGKQLRTRTIEEKGGPLTVVAVPRAIEVTNDEMNLVPVIFPGADTSFLATLQLGRPVIASGGARVVWVRRRNLLVRETLRHGVSRPARQYLDVRGRPMQVTNTDDGGCYVTVSTARRSQPSLLYFSPQSLQAPHPKPTAVHRGRPVRSFAVDPAGGVAYVDVAGGLAKWVPSAKPLR